MKAGTAIGTLIDAMAGGVPLALLYVDIVLAAAAAIAAAALVMSSTGMLAGHLLGHRFGFAGARLLSGRPARPLPA